MKTSIACSLVLLISIATNAYAEDVEVVGVWPGDPPQWTAPGSAELDTSTPDSRNVAGRSVVRLGNVSTPQLHLYPAENASATVVICPGGGYTILAWDLEGTEIAQWFQSRGVSAAVLKYRVPTRQEDERWLPPVQDVQRSLAIIRGGGAKGMTRKHVGVLGFSAGGNAATKTALATKRHYEPADDYDSQSYRPDFAALIYPAYLTKQYESDEMAEDIRVTDSTPPMFLAHAYDDRLSCMGSVGLFSMLKRQGIPSSLHIFATGGHGFGGRETGSEKDLWLPLCYRWLKDLKMTE
ncbi:MAG: alpha/beta hydrolase [Planctomycetota bacterium]